MEYDALTLCSDHRFIRVISDKGVFYDLVPKWRVRAHIFRLRQTYYSAETVIRVHVPPCICRDFTTLPGGEEYCESVWKGGTQLMLPLEPQDQLLIYDMTHK